MRVSEKTTDNSERLDRQARPWFEPGTSRLPVRGWNRSAIGGDPVKIRNILAKLFFECASEVFSTICDPYIRMCVFAVG